MRPVCSSQSGLNFHLQNLISEVLEPIADQVQGGVEVGSTEDLLHEVELLNQAWTEGAEGEPGDIMILGSDAVSLYPSLRKDETTNIRFQEVVDSNVNLEGTSWRDAAVYLATTSTQA